jgi:GntR family transcriptional regulator / MocR family aminotransferase
MELAYSVPRSGLYTAAFLQNGMTSRQAETGASASNIETRALDRFTLKRKGSQGAAPRFPGFDEKTIRRGLLRLADALSRGG